MAIIRIIMIVGVKCDDDDLHKMGDQENESESGIGIGVKRERRCAGLALTLHNCSPPPVVVIRAQLFTPGIGHSLFLSHLFSLICFLIRETSPTPEKSQWSGCESDASVTVSRLQR